MMAHGVPQGSIPGYISNSYSLESYVDDSKLYLSFSVKDAEDAAACLTADLQRIAAWCCNKSRQDETSPVGYTPNAK